MFQVILNYTFASLVLVLINSTIPSFVFGYIVGLHRFIFLTKLMLTSIPTTNISNIQSPTLIKMEGGGRGGGVGGYLCL